MPDLLPGEEVTSLFQARNGGVARAGQVGRIGVSPDAHGTAVDTTEDPSRGWQERRFVPGGLD